MNTTTLSKLEESVALQRDLDLSWQDSALCAQTDPEKFFPENGGSHSKPKRICDRCTVRPECLDYALRNNERFGIWGGLSTTERDRMVRNELPHRHTLARAQRRSRDEVIIAMVGRGIAVSTIATKLQVSVNTVYRRLAKHRQRLHEEATLGKGA